MSAGDGRTRSDRIVAHLVEVADSDGFIPFDRFLDVALYAPEVGYYAHAHARLGPAGNFYTAAHASPLFAQALARRVTHEYHRLGRPASFRIVEAGAGDGTLAAGLASALAGSGAFGEAPLEYVLVERSSALSKLATGRLASSKRPSGMTWNVRPSISYDGPFDGIVIGNEFLDALPFSRWICREGQWWESGVRVAGGRLEWAERIPPAGPGDLPAPSTVPDGVVLELPRRAEGFVREVADHLVRGSAVMIDYGGEQEELLSRFPRGSLAAVRAHTTLGDPLADPGTADLSAFVNFSRVKAAVVRSRLEVLAYEPQADALGRWGYPTVLEEALRTAGSEEERVRLQLAGKNLLFGFANFRVLEFGPA